MSVRAKFKVNAITRRMGTKVKRDGAGNPVKNERGYEDREPCEQWTIQMSPVYGNGDPNHENTKFWEASPGGNLELNCVNADAVKLFELEKEYYVDFSLAP